MQKPGKYAISFKPTGSPSEESASVVESLRRRPKDWVKFMMRFELGLELPEPSRAWKSALTIAGAYIVGGLIPLSAYLLIPDTQRALQALGGCHSHLSRRFWRGQGAFYGSSPDPQRFPNHCDRWPCCCRGFWHCTLDRMTCRGHPRERDAADRLLLR